MQILNKNTMDRREFLTIAGGVTVASSFPLFIGNTALAAANTARVTNRRDSDRVLVVIQLSGGNDGLSMVVPYSDPAYHGARTSTLIEEKDALKVDERIGLHPNLTGLKNLYDSGEVAVVQGASYPNPTRSHFESMDIWQSADVDQRRNASGWLGRALDSTCGNRDNPLVAVNLGGEVPLAMTGNEVRPVSFKTPRAYRWNGRGAARGAFSELNSPREGTAVKNTQLDFLLRVARDARQSSKQILETVERYRTKVAYPQSPLSRDLRTVSALISSGLPTRVYYVSLGGFDTHANQRRRHDQLMKVYSEAVTAFMKDLRAQNLNDRVLTLTFSEFGRRVKENGSRGTDHGVAAPMFLMGSKVKGGLHGEHPDLDELINGDLAMKTDFRQVYASVLEDWLGTKSADVLGGEFERLPVIKARRTAAF